MPRLFALPALLGLAACGSPCADICNPMADYARGCGLSVNASDSADCKQANSGDVTPEQGDVCVEFRDPEKLREWWTCDDVAANMSGGATSE